MGLKVHAICIALNESIFIENLLNTLYPFCSGISILSQYDRDWYGRAVTPDDMTLKVLNYPDPEGKIHMIVRRWRDQAAALNSEMLGLATQPARYIQSHGTSLEEIRAFHATPDYYLIVDADEFYDIDTLPHILDYLSLKRPRGMRMLGYNYLRTWNRRVPTETIRFAQFGFLRPGVMVKYIRTINWNEGRISKILRNLRLPDFSARIYGFIDCPKEIGVFHHGSWLGSDDRLLQKMQKSAHKGDWGMSYIRELDTLPTVFIPTEQLPRNIREGVWPETFFEQPPIISDKISYVLDRS